MPFKKVNIAEINRVFDKQNKTCGCCNETDPPKGEWFLDILPKTKEIFGIVCRECKEHLAFERKHPGAVIGYEGGDEPDAV